MKKYEKNGSARFAVLNKVVRLGPIAMVAWIVSQTDI